MKKSIFRIAALLMAGSLLAVACNDNDKPNKPGDKTDNGDGESANPVEIVLDGSFADWDAITEKVAADNEYVDMAKGTSKEDPIQVIKITNDKDRIYFYIEFQADLLPQNEACGTWGSSYTEDALDVDYGDDDETFREVMHLFIDPDASAKTGFYTFESEDGGPAIPELGCEMCAQFFMYFKPSTGLVSVAFEQTLVGPTKVGAVGDNDQVDAAGYTGDFDYNGTICQDEWPDSGDQAAFPLWGWQNFDDSGTGDNDCPRPYNWKPAKVEASGIAKVEFALEKDDIVNLKDSDEQFACGIIYDWDDRDLIYQAIGPLSIFYVK